MGADKLKLKISASFFKVILFLGFFSSIPLSACMNSEDKLKLGYGLNCLCIISEFNSEIEFP